MNYGATEIKKVQVACV